MCTNKSNDPSFLGVRIQFNSNHCGAHLSAIEIPQGCTLLGLLRQNKMIPISENPSVHVGDIILAIALHPMLTPALKAALQRSHPVYYSLKDCLLKPHISRQCCRLSPYLDSCIINLGAEREFEYDFVIRENLID